MRRIGSPDMAAAAALPHLIRCDRHVAASPDRVFQVLVSGENQSTWMRGHRSTTWLTPERARVGTLREVDLGWNRVREEYLVVEPGARLAFRAVAMRVPLATAFVEDIRTAAAADGGTALSWRVHMAAPTVLKPLAPALIAVAFRPMFDRFADGLARYCETRP